MNPMDIAALAVVTRQAYAQQQAGFAVMRLAMDNAQTQAQGVAQLAHTVDARQLAALTGIGQHLDITI